MASLNGSLQLRRALRQCAQCTSQRASWASSSKATQSFIRQIASSSAASSSKPSQQRLRERSREDAEDTSNVQASSSSTKVEDGARGPSPEELSEFLSPTSRDSGLGKPLPFDASTSAAADLADKQPLPYLSQPLGVPEPPTAMTGAKGNSLRGEADPNAFSEKRMQKRKLIVKEATRGYFHDFHAVRSHGGKTWRAPGTLIREDRALYFPDIIGTRLSDRSKVSTTQLLSGNVSVLSFLTSKISEEHTKSFYQPTLDLYASNPKLRFVQVNLQENPLKGFLISLFLSSLRSQIPPQFHPTYLFSHQNMEMQRASLGLHNKHVGYTYLIDTECRIRWAGSAFAEPAERNALIACTGVLLARAGEAKMPGSSAS